MSLIPLAPFFLFTFYFLLLTFPAAIGFLLAPQSYPGTLEFLHHLGGAQMLLNALFKSQRKIFAQQCPINIAHQSLNRRFVLCIHSASSLSSFSHHFSTAAFDF
jgi:hypothetical protein